MRLSDQRGKGSAMFSLKSRIAILEAGTSTGATLIYEGITPHERAAAMALAQAAQGLVIFVSSLDVAL